MYRVLYIENEPLNTRLVRKMLKPMGYHVMDAETAIQGLQLANEHQPDVILLDVNLSDVMGYDVTRQLKQSDLAHIPVVILTADTTSRIYQICIEAGCDAFLNKPVNAGTLHRTIQYVAQQATVA